MYNQNQELIIGTSTNNYARQHVSCSPSGFALQYSKPHARSLIGWHQMAGISGAGCWTSVWPENRCDTADMFCVPGGMCNALACVVVALPMYLSTLKVL